MKTQSTDLKFKSICVSELNDSDLNKVAGGSPVTNTIEIITRAATYGTWFDYAL